MPAPLWVAIAAAIGAVLCAAFILSTAADPGAPVAVATSDLPAGHTVSHSDLRLVDPGTALAALYRRPDAQTAEGQVLTHAVPSGVPLAHSDVAPPAAPSGLRAISVPLDPSHAVGGALRRGDTVDVIDASGGDAVWIVTGAQVLNVGVEVPGSRSLGGSSRYAVTLAVDAAGALRVADAVTAGKVDIVRSTGAPPVAVSPVPPTTVRR